ncbi:nucleotide kinase domain-containing protein [Sphingosinicella sp. BN140058]|uniref:nucleotide kinase domain-containing protein n=1 Tax=Sphingosinicella sp. BN140058 TaxID=1892855 RepID=UPI0010108A8A|nr:nucleotide kinase domain-containing protein [Sphingosinicella sp. BN140058]QAY80155.1 hypothetical protein ETR14_26290 [Sphingosinicella sp. BN140058]
MNPQLEPTVVLDSYWRFAAERHAMYLRRLEDPIGPWTDDPVLRAHRFTNTYRAADRVSQYLIREVIYADHRSVDPTDTIFRILLFKIFNKVDTWEMIEHAFGPISWQAFDAAAVDDLLTRALDRGATIYSAAYIMPSPDLGHARKHSNHIRLLSRMMEDGIAARIARCGSLREVYELLRGQPSLGPFLAFQFAIDINYSDAISFSEEEFVVPGPGALDGISKCFSSIGKLSPTDVIMETTAVQEREFERLGLSFSGLFGRRLKLIDVQNCYCEVSKYARVKHPEFPGIAGRTRIKQSYGQPQQALSQPFFPPRWALQVPVYKPAPQLSAQGLLF